MKQQEILKKIIPDFRADHSITGVMLMGSVASGTQYPNSDLDLFILGRKNKFETDFVDDIMVECHYLNHETAQSRLDKSGMEVYHYLGSKIVYDMDGRLIKLMRKAMNKYKNYQASDREKNEVKHFLYSAKLKINAAVGKEEYLASDFITATASWKIIEAVFAVNNIPLPPSCRVLQQLPNLKKLPTDNWFQKLFSKETDTRTEMMLFIIDWVLLML